MNKPGPLKFSWRYLRDRRLSLAAGVFWKAVVGLLPMQVPLLTGALVDGLRGRPVKLYGLHFRNFPREEVLGIIVLLLAVIAVAGGLGGYFGSAISARISRRFVRRIRQAIVNKWEFASLEFRQSYGMCRLFHQTIAGPDSARRFAETAFFEIPAGVARTAYPIVMLFVIAPRLALIPLAVLPAQFLITAWLRSRRPHTSKRSGKGKASLIRTVKESLDGIETIQTLGAENVMQSKIRSHADAVRRADVRSRRLAGMVTGSTWALTMIGYALSVWQAGVHVLSGQLSLGNFIAFSWFVRYVYSPFRGISKKAYMYQNGARSVRRIQEFLDAPSTIREAPDARSLKICGGRIELHDVHFSYAGEPALREITLEVGEKTLVGITGRSGAGKTTLLRLVARLCDPSQGWILIDDRDIRTCTLTSLRSQIAMVPQWPVVFSADVLENIQLAKPEASVAELEAAAEAAGALEFICELKKGWKTRLGEKGVRLSAGQVQRLAIARALLRNPKILLLDEPTASLDAEAEAAFVATLERLRKRMTILFAGNCPAAFLRADAVVTLERDRAAGRGSRCTVVTARAACSGFANRGGNAR